MIVKNGATGVFGCVHLIDATTGAPIKGATAPSITVAYFNVAASSVTHASAVTMTLGMWVSNGFVEIDPTNFPGRYQVGLPNAAFVALGEVLITVSGATNQAPFAFAFQISANDPNVALTDTPSVSLATDGAGHINAAVVLGAVASVAGNVGGSIAGSVNNVNMPVPIDLTVSVDPASPPDTLGYHIHAAGTAAFGNMVIDQNARTQTYYETDAVTVAKAWNLDNGVNPTQRTT